MYNFGFLILNSCEIVSLDPQLIVFIASKHETERKKEILILVLKHKIQRTEFKFEKTTLKNGSLLYYITIIMK